MKLIEKTLASVAVLCVCALLASAAAAEMIDYHKPGELDPLPAGTASLYKTPWRSNVRTAGAWEALQGMGIYYKHVPNWTVDQHTNIMKQMVECGVTRLRLAPHHTLYIHRDWTEPKPNEVQVLNRELQGCKAAGIRPCVTFVHVPPMGKSDEMMKWFKRNWNKGLLPFGEPGSPEEKLFFEKTYLSFSFILEAARKAGFTQPGSYDLEIGQNLWWGFPAMEPFPGLTLEMLQPGGQVYEFGKKLMDRARNEGYVEPTFWWGQCYHHFDKMSDAEVPDECVGRAISYYSSWTGITTKTWFNSKAAKAAGVEDAWPTRETPRFLEGTPPEMVLARPEGHMADRSRRDCLLDLLTGSKTPTAVTSLGTTPKIIPNWRDGGMSGWRLKQRGLTRTYAFWLNQGVPFVLLHSAYEGGREDLGESEHSKLPSMTDPLAFKWSDSLPLTTIRSFRTALEGARRVDELIPLGFRYSLDYNPVLIPATDKVGPMRASDLVALLPFQIDSKKFAVAAYILTPNIAQLLAPGKMTLEIDKELDGRVTVMRPCTQEKTRAEIIDRNNDATTIEFEIADDVTWLIFEID